MSFLTNGVRVVTVTAFLLFFVATGVAGSFRIRRKEEPDEPEETPFDAPHVNFLVEMIGKEVYRAISARKYKFFIYMTVGKVPDEQSTIAFLSTICNVLYGCCIWLGFLFFRRDRMLLATLLTLYVGPAIILVLIGSFAGALVAFAMYPVTSVMVLWLWYFLTSQIAQALGRYLGLDSDKDGDVDFLDFLHWAASKRWGQFLGLPKLYSMLDKLCQDPFQEINRRLDRITETISKNGSPQKENNTADRQKENSTPEVTPIKQK